MRRWCSLLLVMLSACAGASRADTVAGADAPHSVRPGVNARYYDEDALGTWVERFEGERREVVAHKLEILAAIGLAPGMRVADVGAGTGLYFEDLAREVGAEGEVWATDIVPVFLERLRERKQATGLSQVRVVAATPLDPGLPVAHLDRVFMCDVYHHIEYPQAYMAALRESLAPAGELILVDFERIEGVTSRAMLAHVRASKQTVLQELAVAGFELVEEVELGLRENYVLRLRARIRDP